MSLSAMRYEAKSDDCSVLRRLTPGQQGLGRRGLITTKGAKRRMVRYWWNCFIPRSRSCKQWLEYLRQLPPEHGDAFNPLMILPVAS